MPAHDEPSSLDAVANALLLARQDIEVILAAEPAWQAMQHLAATADHGNARERELVAARLAMVPAYRSLRRINEALHGLAAYVAGQAANRSNNWAGSLTDATPALQQVAAEFAAGARAEQSAERHDGAGQLSGWQSKADAGPEAGGDAASQPAVDLDHLISLIRRGTKERGPQPLNGLLAGVAAPRPLMLPGEDKRPVFPETTASAAKADAAPVDLVPVRTARPQAEPAEVEIIVEEGKPSGPSAIPVQVLQATPMPGEEAVVEIVPHTPQPADDPAISAAAGVRRFMSAWSDRSKS